MAAIATTAAGFRWPRTSSQHFDLKPGDRVLDVGCGKGFLVKDLMKACPGLEAFGLDISRYALMHCEPEVVGRLHLGTAIKLPFPDNSFNAVISLNTIHNLERDECVDARCARSQRLAPGAASCRSTPIARRSRRRLFEDWVLTAKFHDYPEGWIDAVSRSRLYRRLLLDHHRVSP